MTTVKKQVLVDLVVRLAEFYVDNEPWTVEGLKELSDAAKALNLKKKEVKVDKEVN
jgi:hypothetical protein